MPPRRACDVCYKRKIQCLIKIKGEPCDWCSSQGLSCTFDRVIHKDPNKRTTSDVVQELSHRVEELEEALHSARSPSTSESTLPWAQRTFPEVPSQFSYLLTTSTSPSSPADQQSARYVPAATIAANARPAQQQASPAVLQSSYQLSRCQLGSNWYFKGVGLFSTRGRQWISEGAGQRVFLENFDIFGNPVGSRSHHVSSALPDRPRILPPEVACRFLGDVFFKSKAWFVFPVLDRGLFESTIIRAYDVNAPDAGVQASAQACLWALLALVGRTAEARQVDSLLQPDECAHEAAHLLSLVKGLVNVDSLEATLLLKTQGLCHEAYITFTSACRLVCDLGGHYLIKGLVSLPQHIPIFDPQLRLHIRGLFWLCYCFDKDLSLRTGSPPLLTSDYCDVGGIEECSSSQARHIRLAKIQEDAIRLLCSPRAFRYSDGDLSSHVRKLDDELEEWRLSVEPSYRPRLSIPPGSSPAVPQSYSAEDRTHIIRLQLDYLFTMINIHTLVRKCGDFERNLPDDLHSVVHSSADLSIEASRSIFRFLDTVIDFWKESAVWIVSHYAPMAAMPLFLNILIHPVGNPADSDLQIMSSIGNISRDFPTAGLSKKEIGHIQEIDEFVMELVRLGHSAAWKAKKGEREHDLDIIHR